MEINGEDFLASLNRLLEGLHQAGLTNFGSHLSIIYVAPGAQHVGTQINIGAHPNPPKGREKGTSETGKEANPPFNANTPLSALFRESHHEELRQIIDSWRQYLIGDDPIIDALAVNNFQFDFEQTRPVCIYMDLARLISHDALSEPMSVLAAYLFLHSNLSRSENALYVQLKRYKKLCE